MIRKLMNWLHISGLWSLLSYLVVGALATVVEWTAFWVLEGRMGMPYPAATALAFAFSTFANWAFGRLLVFKAPTGCSLAKEIGKVYLASAVGLLLNLAIMFVLVDGMGQNEMISKMIATVLVFGYNYLIRKRLIYKK
ncbi:MAG TPA: GtrA family protein [Candidatus Fournierella pullicola]|uniref:GtrA family protein n=1 Tax=Candidatus Allofournierella pullicola TaxID=2838596 RepID=A0A9D2ACZ6_9FIRM|nr:GtrA family protein [Candidatus Fournierella pullicola]